MLKPHQSTIGIASSSSVEMSCQIVSFEPRKRLYHIGMYMYHYMRYYLFVKEIYQYGIHVLYQFG